MEMGGKFTLVSDHFTSVDGVKIRYFTTSGRESNKWLVFVHGAGGDATAWKSVQKICFEAGYDSVAIDLRGHGLSDDPIDCGAYAFEKLAQDIATLIDRLNLTDVVVVGHCFGGMAAIVLASKNYPRVNAFVLIDTSYMPACFGFVSPTWTWLAGLTRMLAHLFPPGTRQVRPTYDIYIGSKDIDLRRFISDIRATSLRSYLFCYSDIFGFDATHLLEKIDVPVLVVCGEQDKIFPPYISKKLASYIKKSELEIIPEANHIIVISKPALLAESILKFVKKIGN